MSISFEIDTKEFQANLNKSKLDMVSRASNVVERTAREAVNYARSYKGETSGASVNSAGNYVPVANRVNRKAHPGGWGDITGNLANSIQAGKVKITRSTIQADFGVIVDIEGSLEYAEILDERDGYSVLAGADKEAQRALNRNKRKIIQ